MTQLVLSQTRTNRQIRTKKKDGEKRNFLTLQEFIKINPDLIEELKPFKNIKNRRIKNSRLTQNLIIF